MNKSWNWQIIFEKKLDVLKKIGPDKTATAITAVENGFFAPVQSKDTSEAKQKLCALATGDKTLGDVVKVEDAVKAGMHVAIAIAADKIYNLVAPRLTAWMVTLVDMAVAALMELIDGVAGLIPEVGGLIADIFTLIIGTLTLLDLFLLQLPGQLEGFVLVILILQVSCEVLVLKLSHGLRVR